MTAFFEKYASRITAYRLPSYSPDYNPIGMPWKKTEEKETRLRYFPDFRSLRNRADEALLHFENMREEVLSLFGLYNRLPRKKSAGITINFNMEIEVQKMITS